MNDSPAPLSGTPRAREIMAQVDDMAVTPDTWQGVLTKCAKVEALAIVEQSEAAQLSALVALLQASNPTNMGGQAVHLTNPERARLADRVRALAGLDDTGEEVADDASPVARAS